MSSSLSKEFFELIKAIGESKSKQEEERIIVEEVKALKATLASTSGSASRRARELIVRLIYVEMLGHDASWGYVMAVQQTASHDLSQKRAGYLACALMLSPDHDFRFMLVNQMQRDLGSANVLESSAALIAVCKLVTVDMIPALVTKIAELLEHEQTLVRKKAVMALHRFYQLDQGSVAHLHEKIKSKLRDRDPSVMGAALCLLHDMARADPGGQTELVDQYVSILKQITEHRLPRDFDHHRMPAPWIQIKLLQLLATLGTNDKRASEAMYEVLGEAMRRADTGTNIGYAVVYEVVRTVTTIWPDSLLLDAAASAISRFITSDSHNLKYLGVTGLAAVVRDHPRYAAQHQMAVIECLEDPDETLKRKTLELLYRMTNPVNAEVVVDKLLHFLEEASDQFLRIDLVTRIAQLAERYSPDNTWYVETMTRVFTLAGDLVDAEVAHNLLRLLAEGAAREDDDDDDDQEHRDANADGNGTANGGVDAENVEMRSCACRLFVDALRKPVVPDILLKVAFWTLGEYAYLLSSSNPDMSAEPYIELDDAARLICQVVDRGSVSDSITRAYGITALAKITAQLGRALPEVLTILEKYKSSHATDLQQRCHEVRLLVDDLPTLKTVLPVDASCEDFDDVDFSFLNEFVEILRAAGAPEYNPPPSFLEAENGDGGLDLGDGDAPAAPAAPSLRFDAYEAPSVFEPTQLPPTVSSPLSSVGGGSSGGDYPTANLASASSSGFPNASQTSNAPASFSDLAPKLSGGGAKSVWGPQGYTGNLSGTLGGAAQSHAVPAAYAAPPPPPQAAAAHPVPSAISAPPAALDLTGMAMDDNRSSGFEDAHNSPLPPPLPPKKPAPVERVLTEKEKMAQALFGGVAADSRPTRRGGSAAGAVRKPAPQPGIPTAPSQEGDLLGDAFGGGGGGASSSSSAQASDDLLSLGSLGGGGGSVAAPTSSLNSLMSGLNVASSVSTPAATPTRPSADNLLSFGSAASPMGDLMLGSPIPQSSSSSSHFSGNVASAFPAPNSSASSSSSFMQFSGMSLQAKPTAPSMPAPSVKPAAAIAGGNLMDLFSTTTPTPPAATAIPTTTTTTTTRASPPPLVGKPMATAQFGSLWGAHPAETRLSIASTFPFDQFLNRVKTNLGAALVEHIATTHEAIFAGTLGADLVLIHSKDRPGKGVDLMVRTKTPATTQRIVDAVRSVLM